MNTDAHGTEELAWSKSSYSSNEGGECVEVAVCAGAVHVRDSKDPASAQLTVAGASWTDFVRFAAQA
ncbi:DUF397 domain-containing protein [Streptomyces sp. Wb2n-11]|uniref:DUF397 domain-containing protein n=1 Tax=Streptomyces sp. Wb2n-11 TaxID=1030533 RepID=UPI000B281D2A|nr:DUF397 domain-containing protein [Streptomyces sp. Wb2n-11]